MAFPAAEYPWQMRGNFKVLGVRVDAVQISDVVTQMQGWIQGRRKAHYIAVTGMHGVTEARYDPAFRAVLNAADLVVPDGMPLVWLGRRFGYSLKRRVYGPEPMLAFCQQTASKGYRHFFYGGSPDVPERLADLLRRRCPGLQVAGTYSPPFRPPSREEDNELVELIRAADPDVLWVGLSTPKQERWMSEHRERLNIPVMVGVGAAFDLTTGRVKQAPAWMQENGLEWLFRLLQEPRRLWRRYLLYGSKFVWNVALELFGVRRFD